MVWCCGCCCGLLLAVVLTAVVSIVVVLIILVCFWLLLLCFSLLVFLCCSRLLRVAVVVYCCLLFWLLLLMLLLPFVCFVIVFVVIIAAMLQFSFQYRLHEGHKKRSLLFLLHCSQAQRRAAFSESQFSTKIYRFFRWLNKPQDTRIPPCMSAWFKQCRFHYTPIINTGTTYSGAKSNTIVSLQTTPLPRTIFHITRPIENNNRIIIHNTYPIDKY